MRKSEKNSSKLAILYLTIVKIPDIEAHTIQMIRTCDALAETGASVFLQLPIRIDAVRPAKILQSIRKFYGVKGLFTLIPAPPPMIWTRKKKLNTILHLFSIILYSLIGVILANILAIAQQRKILIYTRTPPILACLEIWRPLLRKTRIIYECHNLRQEYETQGFLKRLFLKGLRTSRVIIAISSFLKKEIRSLVGPDKMIYVLHDAYDSNIFRNLSDNPSYLREELGLPRDKWIAAYVGQLWSWKKPEFIIDAFRNLVDNDVLLLFIGGTQQDIERLRRYAEQNNVRNVLFIGFVPPLLVPKYLKAVDCLIHYTPSANIMKSYSPLKIFEYMAAGKPILAPKQPWIEEILKDGETALLFDENSPEDLADKVRLLRIRKDLAQQLGRNALRASSNYTYIERARRLLEILQKVI